MDELQFEDDLRRAFAEAPAAPDADAFARALVRRLDRGRRMRAVLASVSVAVLALSAWPLLDAVSFDPAVLLTGGGAPDTPVDPAIWAALGLAGLLAWFSFRSVIEEG